MKIQCACGAKYELEIVPEMLPVQFVCRNCGQDYSAYINDLIRTQMGAQAPAPQVQPAAPAVSTAPAATAPTAAPAAPEGSRLRISRPQTHEAPQQQEQAAGSKYCARHRTELTTDSCHVCKKPICPQCVETFGPYCSPFCRNKVEGVSMNAPAITGKFAAQRQFWRKTGRIGTVAGVIVFGALAFWLWYAWIGSVPRKYFSVRFDVISHSGASRLVGEDQIVFLHGGTLARYDLKTKQKIWSQELVTPQQVDAVIAREDEEAARNHEEHDVTLPALRQKFARIGLEEELSLHGSGKNIWIAKENILTLYDWDTGNMVKQVVLTNNFDTWKDNGGEILAVGTAANGAPMVTHVNADDGTMRTEDFSPPKGGAAVVAQNAPRPAPSNGGGGLPISRNGQSGPLDPQRVARDAQNLTLPARLALPALIANSENNRQINEAMRSEDAQQNPQTAARSAPQQQQFANFQDFNFFPDGTSYIALAVHLMHENIVQRDAMKAPPKTSALNDANLSTANETKAVNQQLNELQRNSGGGTVTEDDSTYQVAIRRVTSPTADWVGDVTGPPQLFPLETVNVLAAGKTVIAFDKSNKQLWQANLTYNVFGGGGMPGQEEPEQSIYGQGPCVEHNGTLYVFDQAVLTAFDPTSGNVRWRIPSVGVVGLFFDDQGKLYLNTTTGNPDDIKYSRQIDVTKQTEAVVDKIDPATGTILWSANPGAYISYLSGKYIYAYQYNDAVDEDEVMSDAASGLEKPAYFRLIRINPANGRTMWFYNEGRAPQDIEFTNNIITIVFKKEVEVLRFFTF